MEPGALLHDHEHGAGRLVRLAPADGLVLVAGQPLAGTGRDLTAGSANNAGGQIAAGGALKATVTGALDNRGGLIEADRLDVSAGSLDNRAAGQLASLGAGASIRLFTTTSPSP